MFTEGVRLVFETARDLLNQTVTRLVATKRKHRRRCIDANDRNARRYSINLMMGSNR